MRQWLAVVGRGYLSRSQTVAVQNRWIGSSSPSVGSGNRSSAEVEAGLEVELASSSAWAFGSVQWNRKSR